MIRWLIRRKLGSAEKDLGASVDYLRHVVRVSLPAFFKFAKLLPLSQYRRELSADAYHVARLVATRDEDCGTCVQIEVNLARKDGVSAEVIRAVLDRCPENLPDELADVYRFAESVVLADGNDGVLRDRVRQHVSERAFVELAFAIASCRVFPITKRALGYATSCADVEIVV